MSHSKYMKRGESYSLNTLYASEKKKYTNICGVCGTQGYSPVILEEDLCDRDPDVVPYTKNKIIHDELIRILEPLYLDSLGRCEVCAKIQDKECNYRK